MNSRSANQKGRLVATRAMQHGFPRYSTQTNRAPQPPETSMKTIPALQAQTRAHIGLTGQKSIMEGRVTNQY